jgi:glutathione-regulated potassium-efflux system protein KefB
MILKCAGIYGVARLWGAGHAEAAERAVLMGQGGEFAFVLYGAAVAVGLVTAGEGAVLTAIIIVSMALTPLLVILHDWWRERHATKGADGEGLEGPDGLRENALIVGFGRVGQVVSQPLLERGFEIAMIENDPEMIEAAAEFGFKVHYGDGTRLDILHAAGAAEAGVIVVAVDDRQAAVRIVELCKAEFPLVPVLARAFDRQEALKLAAAGVDWQIRETLLSSMALGEEVLRVLGVPEEEVAEVMAEVRERDQMRFERQLVGGITAARDLIRGTLPGWKGGA